MDTPSQSFIDLLIYLYSRKGAILAVENETATVIDTYREMRGYAESKNIPRMKLAALAAESELLLKEYEIKDKDALLDLVNQTQGLAEQLGNEDVSAKAMWQKMNIYLDELVLTTRLLRYQPGYRRIWR